MIARLLFFVSLFSFFSQTSGAQETPKTLLWRITGNDFKKPCYLYGTMHTQDRRAYFLGDSVYSSIQACDGFAMEVDPAETIDTIWAMGENKKLDIEYRQAIENDLVQKGPEYYKERAKEFDSMLVKMRKQHQDISLRDFNRLERAYRRRLRNDMKTRLDLYLFDLAKKQGKIVGAVEDLIDQTSIKHEKNQFDEEAFLKKKKKKYADFEEWMIETYAAAELDELESFNRECQSKAMQTIMLYNRNDKMARRIDSLGKIRSSFCAVGCGHLPGDSGVINLLRKRGFIVEPVFSSKKIEPGNIIIENKLTRLIDISDADSNYVVQMPGRPTDFSSITKKMVVKAYKELSNEILLLCGIYEDGKTYKTVEKVKEEIKDFFSKHDIKLYDTKKIVRQQLDGYEIFFRNREGYIRVHIFCNMGKTYLFGAGSKYKDSANSVRCENYLSGYKMLLNRPSQQSNLLVFINAEKAFSIGMPTIPRKENIKGNNTYTKEDVTLFSCIDPKRKTSYLVLTKEPYKGYFPGFDSAMFTQTVTEIKRDIVQKYADSEDNVQLDGYPALKIKITGEADSKQQLIYMVMAMRQNRFYCVTARGLALPENELLFEAYINTFRFTPYQQTLFEKQEGGNNLFTVKAPSAIVELVLKKDNRNKNEIPVKKVQSDYYAFDSSTATTYGVTSFYLGKYFWVNGETEFLNEYAVAFFNDSMAIKNTYNNDSLIYKQDVCNGELIGKELLIKQVENNSYTRLRILHYADSVFIISMKGDGEMVTKENADTFFNSFRFVRENYATTIFYSKTQTLLNDLQSKDSSLCADAIKILKQRLRFPRQDLILLLNALLFDYPKTKMNADIPELLSLVIANYPEEGALDFIRKNYPLLKGTKENIRMYMFNILSAYKTRQSYDLLKQFFLNDEPSPANYTTVLINFSNATSLAASLFPEIAVKIKDPDMVTTILDMANMLIDSNKLEYNAVSSYEEDIITISKKTLKLYEENNYEGYYVAHIEALVKLLVKMNQKKSNSLLKDFIAVQNYGLNNVIIMAMVKNGQPVAEDIFDKYCEDPNRRIALYDDLFSINKQSAFRGKYATQKSFAETFAVIYTDNQISSRISKDYDVVAIKEEAVNGVLSRFYIFKVKCHYTYENTSYTCVIGPFSPVESNLSIPNGKEKYILYRIKYDAETVNSLFEDFIEKITRMK